MEEKELKVVRPRLKLIGENGNACNLIAKALRAGKEAGWTRTHSHWFMDQVTSGDFDNVLQVIMIHFDVY